MKYTLAPDVVDVIANSDYTINVTFADGKVVRFDVSPYLDRGYFTELKDINYFNQVHIDEMGAVCWPHEQDFSCELIYNQGVELSLKK